jgi:beta-lactam-binding protein with PASTA domain
MLKFFKSRQLWLTLGSLAVLGLLVYFAVFFLILPAYTRHGKSVIVPDVMAIRGIRAVDSLKEAGFKPVIRDSIYVPDMPPGTVVNQYPRPYSRVKPKRTIFLTVNKYEPPSVSMPDILNPSISLYQAKAKLESWRLSVGKVTRRPDIASNVVLETWYEGRKIRAGEKVPQGAKIDLVVAEGLGNTYVSVPQLVGLSYGEALSILNSLGLNPGSLRYSGVGGSGEYGKIFNQSPAFSDSDSIRVGSSIDLFIYGVEPESFETVDTVQSNQ